MQLAVSKLETHPTGTQNPNAVVNGNWQTLEAAFAGKQSRWFGASEIIPTTTDGAGPASTREIAAARPGIRGVQFADAATSSAEAQFVLPKTWDVGALTVILVWSSALAGDVRWQAQAHSAGDNETLDADFGAAVAATDTLGVANNVARATLAGIALGGTGAAKLDLVTLRISRLGNDAADTLAGTAELIGALVVFSRNAANEN